MFLSGLFGYILDRNGYGVAPMLLSFVLAPPLLESNMRKAFIISNGGLGIFVDKPISAFLLLALLAIVMTPPVVKFILRKAGIRKK